MKIIDTDRLALRLLSTDDAAFILRLLNEPSWIQFIGDRNIRTLADAETYIRNGPQKMQAEHGFSLFLVELKSNQVAIGLCGLIKRESLDDVDLGFAFLPEYWGKGYALEAAQGTLNYGRTQLRLSRIVAITVAENQSSVNLLNKLGFEFEETITQENEKLELFALGF